MLQKAVGCTTTMPISGRQGSSDIGLPVQPAVVPAIAPVVPTAVTPIVPAAIAPAAIAPSAIAPPAIAPPGELRLGVDGDERLAVLGVLLDGVGYRGADGLQPLGDVAWLLGLGAAVGREGGRCVGRRDVEAEDGDARPPSTRVPSSSPREISTSCGCSRRARATSSRATRSCAWCAASTTTASTARSTRASVGCAASSRTPAGPKR